MPSDTPLSITIPLTEPAEAIKTLLRAIENEHAVRVNTINVVWRDFISIADSANDKGVIESININLTKQGG